MKPDLSWPPAPQFGVAPHKQLKPDITPARVIACAHLATFAALAESKLVKNEAPLGDDSLIRSPLQLVTGTLAEFLDTLRTAGGAEVALSPPDLAALRVVEGTGGEGQPPLKNRPLDGRLLVKWGQILTDSPHLCLIDVKAKWGVSGLGPMRGDIAIFTDGHCAIVTKSMCRKCQHFECVEFTPAEQPEQPPTIRLRVHFTATLTHLLRVVIETPEGEKQKAESGEQKPES